MATIASGMRMPRSSVNFSRGKILPRATPVKSGTRHSTSVTRRSLSQFSRSLKVIFCLVLISFLGDRLAVFHHVLLALATGFAKGRKNGAVKKVLPKMPLGVPLHGTGKRMGALHFKRFDQTVRRKPCSTQS